MTLQADGSKRRWPFNPTEMPQSRTKLLDSRMVGYTEVILERDSASSKQKPGLSREGQPRFSVMSPASEIRRRL